VRHAHFDNDPLRKGFGFDRAASRQFWLLPATRDQITGLRIAEIG